MSMKQDFVNEIEGLLNSLGNYEWQSEGAKTYWDALRTSKEVQKPLFTDNGKLILKFLQEHSEIPIWKSRDIAEGIFISSRSVSGAIRKLVSDGYVEKMGQNPVIYSITEKGMNINLEEITE